MKGGKPWSDFPSGWRTGPEHKTDKQEQINTVILDFLKFYSYLKGRFLQTEKERQKERGLPSAKPLPKWTQWLELI